MSVLINFKICDNVCECGGIEACPTGALFWDEENRRIGIDNSKCVSCGACVVECPVEAIKVARSDEEFEKIKKEFEDDPRKVSDLFIERYGSMPINPDFLITFKNFDKELSLHTKPLLVEFFRDNDLQCLRKSVPIKELIPGEDIVFRKVRVEDGCEYSKEFPCLVLFRDGKMDGKIEGYFGEDDKERLKDLLRELINVENPNCPCTHECEGHGKCSECRDYHRKCGDLTFCGK